MSVDYLATQGAKASAASVLPDNLGLVQDMHRNGIFYVFDFQCTRK